MVPVEHGLLLAATLFLLGLAGVLVRRNLVFMLMSVEVMLNAAGLAFVVAGARWDNPEGQAMFVLVLTLAAAEAAVVLALILQLQRRFQTVDSHAVGELRG